MSTSRELLAILNDLAKRVAERQLAESDAIASIKHAVQKFPEVRDKWTEERATAELDKRVKRHVAKRNKERDAEITRRLAELGMERPTLDGHVPPISQDDPSYSSTLGDYAEYLNVNIRSSWRLLKSFEAREEDHEVLLAAAGGNPAVTREQAVDALKRLPEAKRTALRTEVRAKLLTERRAFTERRYGDFGQAAEG